MEVLKPGEQQEVGPRKEVGPGADAPAGSVEEPVEAAEEPPVKEDMEGPTVRLEMICERVCVIVSFAGEAAASTDINVAGQAYGSA